MGTRLSFASAFVILGAFTGTASLVDAATSPALQVRCAPASDHLQCEIRNASFGTTYGLKLTYSATVFPTRDTERGSEMVFAMDGLGPRATMTVRLPLKQKLKPGQRIADLAVLATPL